MSFALLFPGQGSQVPGMGRELALAHPVVRETFQEADEILGFPLSRVAWEGPEEALTETRNAQPALLVHSVAVHRLLRDRLAPVAMAAGHSLGEFSAHVAAGTLDFAAGVRAVRLRGELMFAAGGARPGTMAAVLGLGDEETEALCRSASSAAEVVVPANYNAEGQIVISGDVPAVERAMAGAREAGAKRVLPLRVSGAFHSPLMAEAEKGLREGLEGLHFSASAFPVVSNVTARPVHSPEEARELLVRQLTSPVRWTASVRHMVESGVDRFLELGPGSVLSGLNRRTAREALSSAVGEPAQVDSLDPRFLA